MSNLPPDTTIDMVDPPTNEDWADFQAFLSYTRRDLEDLRADVDALMDTPVGIHPTQWKEIHDRLTEIETALLSIEEQARKELT
uniref:Uncharacterized protein n=1 Tax=viral metagenome TaxID=1070528 RepID=A0A6H1ZRU0_9ZZZZ